MLLLQREIAGDEADFLCPSQVSSGRHSSGWARMLLAKKPFKLVAVALANKMARTARAREPEALSAPRQAR